jgi:hypothetical protein
MKVTLRHVAHVRSGDKGDTANVVVVAYSDHLYQVLVEQLTAERFHEWYAGVVAGPVERYEVPAIGALNFVAHGALGGGVSRSLCLDNYGKALCSALLGLELEVPDEFEAELVGPRSGGGGNHGEH